MIAEEEPPLEGGTKLCPGVAPDATWDAPEALRGEITGTRRGSRCSTATLDRTIYNYSSTCYYEVVYIQGGNLLNEADSARATRGRLDRSDVVMLRAA